MKSTIASNRTNLQDTPYSLKKRFFKYRALYIMLIPGAIWYLLFHIVPLYGISIAFVEYNPIAGILGSKFVGFDNFQRFLGSSYFTSILTNTVVISGLKLIFGFPLPIIFALCLNEIHNKYFKKTVQTISYMPFFLSWVIVLGISSTLFNEYTGVLKSIFTAIGIENYVDISKNPNTFVAFLVGSHVWKTVGWGSIIYLAALAGIDQEMYEASIIDGAGRWKRLIYITLPSIAHTIAITLILSVGSLLGSDFEQIYLFQGGQQLNTLLLPVSDTLDTWVYRNGIAMGAFSVPAATGSFQSIFGALLVLGTNKLSKKFGYEGIW